MQIEMETKRVVVTGNGEVRLAQHSIPAAQQKSQWATLAAMGCC